MTSPNEYQAPQGRPSSFDEWLAAFREQMLDQLSIKLNAAALEQFAYVLSAREEFLMTALGCIRQQYGSTDRWLEAEYGLGAAQREVLRAFYLE